MKIDVNNDKIVIYDTNHALSAVAKSQLSFWDFHSDHNRETYSSNLEESKFLKVIKYFENEDVHVQLGDYANIYLKEIELTGLKFNQIKEIAAKFKEGLYDRLAFNSFREFVAENIIRTLKIHQLKAAYHLYILGNGANFSVPGSGKTTVVLTVYEKLKHEGKVNTLFVVGPPSCFGPWKNEFIETLGRKPKSIILAGGDKSNRKSKYYEDSTKTAELYLTSFQSLFYDRNELTDFLSQKHIRAYFVIDEAHYIKQINGNWAQAILKQSEKLHYRCVLTGTPTPKSYTDIFNLFDFLWPSFNPISDKEKNFIKYNEEKGDRHPVKKLLIDNIGPLFYRVRKSDLNLMPQNFIEPDLIEMGKYERMIYDAIIKRIKDYAKTEYYKNIEFVNKLSRGRMMRLRQSISYSKLLNTAIDDYDENLYEDLTDLRNIIIQYDNLEIPGKIKFLLERVKELRRNNLKVVIWSNFIGSITLIEKHLKNEGFQCKIIFGNTPIENSISKDEQTREKIRDEFVDPKSGLDILIANPAACAESISLHKTCHNAIYYDLTYNCAQYLQSLDRIHRVGGSELIAANYYFLQYKNTIDKDIKNNLDTKTKKMYEVIEEDYTIYSLDMFDSDGDSEAYVRLFVNNDKTNN